jgi:hypothetical protein
MPQPCFQGPWFPKAQVGRLLWSSIGRSRVSWFVGPMRARNGGPYSFRHLGQTRQRSLVGTRPDDIALWRMFRGIVQKPQKDPAKSRDLT